MQTITTLNQNMTNDTCNDIQKKMRMLCLLPQFQSPVVLRSLRLSLCLLSNIQ